MLLSGDLGISKHLSQVAQQKTVSFQKDLSLRKCLLVATSLAEAWPLECEVILEAAEQTTMSGVTADGTGEAGGEKVPRF